MPSDTARAVTRVRGFLGRRAQAVPGGVVLWVSESAHPAELAQALDLLGIRYQVTRRGHVHPPWTVRINGRPRLAWVNITVTGPGFDALAEAVELPHRLAAAVRAALVRCPPADVP